MSKFVDGYAEVWYNYLKYKIRRGKLCIAKIVAKL